VVLGGGVGGTLTANLLARQPGRDVHVTLVDPTGMHLYQPGFLYAALGKANGRWLARDERTLLRRDVELAVEAAALVEPDRGRVRLAHGGSLAFDYLVLATGSRLVPEEIPGLVKGAHEFYSLEGALRLREALRGFRGGRILVGVTGIPTSAWQLLSGKRSWGSGRSPSASCCWSPSPPASPPPPSTPSTFPASASAWWPGCWPGSWPASRCGVWSTVRSPRWPAAPRTPRR
jgi:Pyridine nucleotide-disulphide oxidoreductase